MILYVAGALRRGRPGRAVSYRKIPPEPADDRPG